MDKERVATPGGALKVNAQADLAAKKVPLRLIETQGALPAKVPPLLTNFEDPDTYCELEMGT